MWLYAYKTYRFHQQKKSTTGTDKLEINPQGSVLPLHTTNPLLGVGVGRGRVRKYFEVGGCTLLLLVLQNTCPSVKGCRPPSQEAQRISKQRLKCPRKEITRETKWTHHRKEHILSEELLGIKLVIISEVSWEGKSGRQRQSLHEDIDSKTQQSAHTPPLTALSLLPH